MSACALLPLAFDPASARPFVGPKLIAVLGLGSVAFAMLLLSGRPRLHPTLVVVIAAHIVALTLATGLSIAPGTSLMGDYYRGMGLATRVGAIGLAMLIGSVAGHGESSMRSMLRVIVATTLVVATYGVVQALGLDPMFGRDALEQINRVGVTEVRIISTLGHPNFVGQFLLFGTGASVALAALESRTALRVAAIIACGVVAIGAIASGSRGAWLAIVIQAMVLLWFGAWSARRASWNWRRVAPIAGIAVLAIAVAGVVLHGPIGEQIEIRSRSFRSDAMTGSSRTLLWRDALPMARSFAVHGSGPETFVLAFAQFESAELERREPYALYDSSHNVLLDALLLSGGLGLATVLGLVFVAARSIARTLRSPRGRPRHLAAVGLGVGLLGYLFDGMFVFDTIPTALYFYVFVALAVSLEVEMDTAPAEWAPPWRRTIAAVAVLATFALLWPRLWLTLRADRQIATASQLAESGQLRHAVAAGRAAVANAEVLGPSPDVRHLLARVYAHAGDPARPPTDDERSLLVAGVAELDRALMATTTPQLVLSERADLFLRLARTTEAVADLREAVRRAPAFWPARARLARVLLELGDVEGAEREAAIALDYNPESADARAVRDEAAAR